MLIFELASCALITNTATAHECCADCCEIEEVCYEHGAENPENPCQFCDFTADPSAWANVVCVQLQGPCVLYACDLADGICHSEANPDGEGCTVEPEPTDAGADAAASDAEIADASDDGGSPIEPRDAGSGDGDAAIERPGGGDRDGAIDPSGDGGGDGDGRSPEMRPGDGDDGEDREADRAESRSDSGCDCHAVTRRGGAPAGLALMAAGFCVLLARRRVAPFASESAR